jgi:hypothetical protein
MGAQQSRLVKAGGDPQLAAQMLEQEFQSGAKGWSPAQIAAYTNPATRDAWVTRQIGQSTKGKFSGPLGAIGKVVSKAAPFVLPLIPGVGPLAAGLGSAAIGKLSGKGLGESLLQGAGSAAGSALLGGQGFKGLGQAGATLGKFGKGALSTIGKTFTTPQGGLDLGKIAGVGIGAAQLGGQRAQRQTAQARLGAEDQLRNQLLQRLLERPNYNFQPTGGVQ